MKRLAVPLLVLAISSLGLVSLPLAAEQSGRGQRGGTLRADVTGLTTAEEEQDARELADRINEAVNVRREVTITLHNDMTLTVAATSRVAVRRYWLIISNPDGSEIRFRASMVAALQIK